MIERTTMATANDFFAPTKPNPANGKPQPVRREVDPVRSSTLTQPTRDEPAKPFAEQLNSTRTEQPATAEPTDADQSAPPPPAQADTSAGESDDTVETPVGTVVDEGDGEATVAEWVAAFEELVGKPAESANEQPEPIVVTGNPSATTDETLISVTTPTETPSADVAAFDVNDTVAVPADRIMPALDPNTVVANTIATAISPAQFAAAQEAIQQAAAPVAVEPVATPVDLRAALTQAQASSAGLHTAVIGKQQTTGPVSPSAPSTIIDQRTQPKPTPTTNGPTPAATPSTVIEPATTSQPVDQTTTSTQPAPASTTSGAEVRAAEATTERQAAPLAQPAQATTTAVAEASTTSTSDVAAPKPIATAKPDLPAPVSREQFVAQNEPSVVRSVSGLVKDNGGEMRIRLDPPSLGNVSVRVKMVGGAAEVSFVTPSGDAAKALGQSLHALKQSLETAGIQVDRLNVRQAQPTDSQSNTNSDTRGGDDPAARDQRQNEQQRAREELAKRWRNVIYGDDLEADLAA